MGSFVNIKIVLKSGEVLRPKGFYYKGKAPKLKIVVVGCEIENNFTKKTFDFNDCDIQLSKYNKFGDLSEL